MHAPPTGIDAYRRTQVQSRTPLELVAMLYDGVFRFLSEAEAAIARQDVPARRAAIERALAIVAELQNTLNLTQGGDIASSLDRLYSFVSFRLLEAASRNDVKPIAEVRQILAPLRDAWRTVAASPATETPR